jgi:hypothetical protein
MGMAGGQNNVGLRELRDTKLEHMPYEGYLKSLGNTVSDM